MDWTEAEEFFATQRAVRRFAPDAIDDATIERVLRAASRAPSARNVQPWRFIVVRDGETKRRLGRIFDELGSQLYGAGAPDHTAWAQVPVLVVVCSEYAFGTSESGVAALGASIYPAVQNLLLAAHAQGLGSVLTTRWKAREEEGASPPRAAGDDGCARHYSSGSACRSGGPDRRRPIREVTYRERFGQPWKE